MRNAKKTLSMMMVAIFTTFIVLSGIPASAATTAQAKAQVTKATAAVVKVEKVVKVSTFNPTTAKSLNTAATKEVAKVNKLGKTYKATYLKLVARYQAVNKKIAVRIAYLANNNVFASADKAVTAAEKATDGDEVDLVGDPAALTAAQAAITNALELIVKLDKNSANYKGLMARVDAANGLIVKAMEEITAAEEAAKLAAEAKAKLEAAVAAAETAVKAVETAPLATEADLTAVLALGVTAKTAVEAVTDVAQAEAFAARLKVVADKGLALKAKLEADKKALEPAKIVTVSAVDGTITVTFDKKALTTPAAADFTVTKSVNGTTPVAVTLSAVTVVSDTAITIAVPTTAAVAADQSIVYSVAYTTGAAVTASAYTVAKASITVVAIDTNKIQVNFATAVDTAVVKATLKQGAATQYTALTFAADKKSAVLTAPTALAAGDYTVVVTGLVSADVTAPITIVAAAAKTIEITSTDLTIGVGSVATFSVKNQYATDMAVLGNAITVTAYDVTANAVVPVTYSATKSEFSLDLTASTTLKVGNDIRVIASYKGLTVSKTLKVIATAVSADVTLGAVAPLTNKTKITVSETGFTLPYTLKNQYGADAKLPVVVAGTTGGVANINLPANGSGVTFVSSNNAIVDPATFAVDSTGKLTFNAGATAGTATITAIINASGKVATTTVVVNALAAIKTIAISSPTALLAAGEVAKLTLSAVDQYGVAVSTITGTTASSSDTNIATVALVNGKLEVTGVTAGTVTVSLKNTVDPTIVYGTATVKFEAAAVPTAITGMTAPTTFEVNASKVLTFDKLTAVDQYGRAYDLQAGDVTTTKVDVANNTFTVDTTNNAQVTFTAGAVAGTQAIKFALANQASFTATYAVVATSSIVSYTVNNAPTTMFAQSVTPVGLTASDYDKTLVVDGKLVDGTIVVLNSTKITNATSTNQAVATVSAAGKVTGLTKGTTTVALWNGATKIAEITVTVNDALPVATAVAFLDTMPSTINASASLTLGTDLEVTDQYGVVIPSVGFWASSSSLVTVTNAATGAITAGATTGTVTMTYVTSNGLVKTMTLTIQ